MKRSENPITSRASGGSVGGGLSEFGHSLMNSFMSKSGRVYDDVVRLRDARGVDDRRWRWGDCKLTFSSLPLPPTTLRRRFVGAPSLLPPCSADDRDGDGDDGDGG